LAWGGRRRRAHTTVEGCAQVGEMGPRGFTERLETRWGGKTRVHTRKGVHMTRGGRGAHGCGRAHMDGGEGT
jgi:hypothetical protein